MVAVNQTLNFSTNPVLKPKIVRTISGHCCEWCANLAGTYSYPDVPHDIYRRHSNCRCTVVYDPGDGRKSRQDVWSKQWGEDSEVLEKRKKIGLSSNNKDYVIQSGGKYKIGSNEWYKSYEIKESKANKYYQKVSSTEDDIANISQSSRMKIDEIKETKNHIFLMNTNCIVEK